MQPIQITIRDFPNSIVLENHIREKAQKMEQYYSRINSCRIVITMPQKHKHQGKLYCVAIDLTVPGKELVVNRKKDEDVYIAIRDAFSAVERQLESYAKKRRGDVKTHEMEDHGVIRRIVAGEDFGFINDDLDGTELFFSKSNVTHPHFSQLKEGDRVSFLKMPASDGWQAHRVSKL